MRHQFDRGVILGIVLLAAMMVAIAVISYLNTRALRADAATATQSRQVIEVVVTIQADTRRLQAAQRAYIISGLEDRLQPYAEATADIRNGIARLKELTAADPAQLERAETAGREFESGIIQLNEVIVLRREKGMEEILKLARNVGPRSFVQPQLDVLDLMNREERERLAARDQKADEAYSQTVAYGITSAALGLVTLGLLVWLLARSTRARLKYADRLAEQREVLNATLTSIGDAVIATDTAGRVTFLNPVAEKLTGWPTVEATGQPLTDVFRIVNESTRRPVDNPALRALADGSVVGLANHTILIARDGSEYPIDDSAAPIRDAAGAVSGAVLVFRDITERKRAEAAQVRLAAIVETSDDAIVSKTLDGTIRTWNRGAERLFGYSADEAVGQSITLIIPPDRQDEERDILDRVRNGKPVRHFETVRVTKDGRPVEISLTVSPVRDADGQIVGASKIGRDITERKRAEAALRAAEERAEFVRRASGVGFWFCDLPFDVLNWDDQVKAHFWLPPDASVTIDTFYARIHPDDREPTRRAIDQSITGHTGYDVYYRTVNPDTGEEKWVRAMGRTFYAADVTPIRFDGVTLDVTVERRAEAAVRAAEERFRHFANTAPAMLWVTEPDGRCSFLSHGWFAFTGQTVADGLGFGWLDAVHPDDRGATGTAFRTANERQEPFALEHRLRRTDGTYRWVIDAGRPRQSATDEFLGYVGSVIDIDDRKRAEEGLREQDKRKDEFLATLAHELRNPLAPVRTGLHLLRARLPEDKAFERTLGMMDRQLGQLVHLVDDLMDVSRVSRGLVALRPERVELRAVVEAAVETVRQSIEAAGHEFTVRLPDVSLVLDADPTRLTQVVANLLNNAAKYTPSGGRIVLSAERDGSTAVLRVTDTGVGIPADMLARVFDMFTQVGSSLARAQGGLGIGLTLVRRLVEMHGGTVTAESLGPDAGSTFVVRLPLAAGVTEPPPVAPAAPTANIGRLRVLVVDDNLDAADSLAMLLDLVGGHEVRTAHSGTDALAVLDGFRPQLILLDLGMPGMTGYEVARRIRERPELAEVRLAALTGWGQEDDRRRTKEAGFDHHLVKPVDPADVDRILADVSNTAPG